MGHVFLHTRRVFGVKLTMSPLCPQRTENHDVSPLDAAVQAFRTRRDQAVAQDAATQAYVRQLEQAYDATGEAAPTP
jgi:hypothetical protein